MELKSILYIMQVAGLKPAITKVDEATFKLTCGYFTWTTGKSTLWLGEVNSSPFYYFKRVRLKEHEGIKCIEFTYTEKPLISGIHDNWGMDTLKLPI